MSYDTSDFLPPLLPNSLSDADLCTVMPKYLAVWNDLSPAEQHIVTVHLHSCPLCMREARLMSHVTELIAALDTADGPSASVDEAVYRAIAARSSDNHRLQSRSAPRLMRLYGRSSRSLVAVAAIAAVLLLAVLTSTYFLAGGWLGHQQVAFSLPETLSWDHYVLYSQHSMTGSHGDQYQVTSYQDMATHQQHVEFNVPGKMDIVVHKHQEQMLGLDMMNHVAQWDAQGWDMDQDDHLFDLARLRHELQSGLATYEGKEQFHNQTVYRIRYPDGHIILLDMHYMPVNVLDNKQQQPMYEELRWLNPSQVESSMWDMNVPQGFSMGNLPSNP